MATIALRVPTVVIGQANLPGGHCYLIFQDPTIIIRNLIGEKVRAELRKQRAGGPHTSSLPLLIGRDVGNGPLDEQLGEKHAIDAFTRGDYLLLVDGRPMTNLDEIILLTRRTSIIFLVPEPTDEQRWARAGITIHHVAQNVYFTDPWEVRVEGGEDHIAPTEKAARMIAADLYTDLIAAEAIGELTV